MTSSGELEVRYQVDAAPGHWFLHAVHALIDVSECQPDRARGCLDDRA